MSSFINEQVREFLLKTLNIIKLAFEQLKKEKIKDLESANEKFNEITTDMIPEIKLRSYLKMNQDGEIDLEFKIDYIIEFLENLENLKYFDDIQPHFEKDVLLIYGTESEVFNFEDDKKSMIKQYPNVRFKKIEGADHMLHEIPKYREILLEIVLDYINS